MWVNNFAMSISQNQITFDHGTFFFVRKANWILLDSQSCECCQNVPKFMQ